MLNRVYRLVAPRQFEPVEVEVTLSDQVIVRPTYLSLCNADIRYYTGSRAPEVLAKKLPMALVHEGVGEVLFDPTNTFSAGELVVMLPNQAHEENSCVAENYLRTSEFCGSGVDGFMQEYLFLPLERVLALPADIAPECAAFTELLSVAHQAIARFQKTAHAQRDTLGVWGDGNVGYLVALLLKILEPTSRIVVFGKNPAKLADFTFVDEVCLVANANRMSVDHAFECVGGSGSIDAIDQIIDVIEPEGTISLLGVTEQQVPINTRMVLEKGLRLVGNSRSSREDFEAVIKLYHAHPEVADYLRALVYDVVPVQTVRQMSDAFELDIRKPMGKVVMAWNA